MKCQNEKIGPYLSIRANRVHHKNPAFPNKSYDHYCTSHQPALRPLTKQYNLYTLHYNKSTHSTIKNPAFAT